MVHKAIKAAHQAAFSTQGSIIVATILLAFIVWITLNNRLTAYLADLGIGTPALGNGNLNQGAGQSLGGLVPGGLGAVGGALFGNGTLQSLPSLGS